MACLKLNHNYTTDLKISWENKCVRYEKTNLNVRSGYMFGFNGQMKVNEMAGVGNHNTAEFWEYDTRLGRRWNLDPVDQVSISNYAINNLNPILVNDPNGDCPTCLTGAVIGAFTEYASIIGSKMLFDGKTFSDANSELGWQDALDITLAAGFGAASGVVDGGITKWTAWISKPTNQKIAAKILEVGVSSIESSLKQIYKDEDFDLKGILVGALAEVGMSSLLKTEVYKDASEKATQKAASSTKRAGDLASRKKPNQKLINKAKGTAKQEAKTAKALKKLDNTGKVIKGTAAKTGANKIQDKIKESKKDE